MKKCQVCPNNLFSYTLVQNPIIVLILLWLLLTITRNLTLFLDKRKTQRMVPRCPLELFYQISKLKVCFLLLFVCIWIDDPYCSIVLFCVCFVAFDGNCLLIIDGLAVEDGQKTWSNDCSISRHFLTCVVAGKHTMTSVYSALPYRTTRPQEKTMHVAYAFSIALQMCNENVCFLLSLLCTLLFKNLQLYQNIPEDSEMTGRTEDWMGDFIIRNAPPAGGKP